MKNVKSRFLRFITFNTQADYDSDSCPSTKAQMEFARVLAAECNEIGLTSIIVSEFGYVYAELPSNIKKKTPVIGFVAHMDTSPDCSGDGVEGVCIPDYDGRDIRLDENTALSSKEFPSLLKYVSDELIVTKGKNLLGADDKAGISEILTAMEYLIENPAIKHGTIKICFTPDEEIGRGTDKFDLELFGADFAYTMDGGEIGELEYKNFNAARAKINITGKSVHPGYSKNIMRNASLIAMEIARQFPEDETPATTEGYEGFYHLSSMTGNVEAAMLDYIVRDFEMTAFERRKAFVADIVAGINEKYGEGAATLNMRDEYYNMEDVLKDKLFVVDLAERAMRSVGVEPKIKAIRGGTDGSRLSFMGLPCPNIFAGGHNFHGPYEYIPVGSMIKACEVIAKIAELAADLEK